MHSDSSATFYSLAPLSALLVSGHPTCSAFASRVRRGSALPHPWRPPCLPADLLVLRAFSAIIQLCLATLWLGKFYGPLSPYLLLPSPTPGALDATIYPFQPFTLPAPATNTHRWILCRTCFHAPRCERTSHARETRGRRDQSRSPDFPILLGARI